MNKKSYASFEKCYNEDGIRRGGAQADIKFCTSKKSNEEFIMKIYKDRSNTDKIFSEFFFTHEKKFSSPFIIKSRKIFFKKSKDPNKTPKYYILFEKFVGRTLEALCLEKKNENKK